VTRAASCKQQRVGTSTAQGHCHPEFAAVEAVLHRRLARSPGGAGVCVYHRGQCVVDLWGGYRDQERNPWLHNTMAPSYSTTKGVTSTLLHILADRGQVDYDEKVSAYWPEFAQGGKESITVRQLLCHQAGLYNIREMVDHATRMLDWAYMVRAIERSVPAHRPGARTAYHGLTYGFIVGELIQRITGEKFSDLIRTEIAEPLGLDGFYIGTPHSELDRAARLIPAGSLSRMQQRFFWRYLELSTAGASGLLRLFGVDSHLTSFHDALAPRGMGELNFSSADVLKQAMPSANGLFTARALARMYAMLAGGGALGKVRILSREALKTLRCRQDSPGKYAVMPFDMRWRLGFHGVFTSKGFDPEAFGHFGFGGSGGWAHPELDLSVALVTNSGAGSPFGSSLTSMISDAVLASARTIQVS
jgi:CubicO group peptidase (beta-lactamase class C family)